MRNFFENNEKPPGNGFTLIETAVAIFIFILAFGAMMSSVVIIYRTQSYSMEQAVAIDEARRGVEIMAKEIRNARYGDNGAYPIEKAAGKDFIFYSDIDDDGLTEKVRYYLATIRSGTQTGECFTSSSPGFCTVPFSGFLTGNLKTAQVRVSSEGYYGNPVTRYAELFVDGAKLANICADCSQCAGAWQGTQTFDVTSAAADGAILFKVSHSNKVKNWCSWRNPNHAVKAIFDLSWVEEIPDSGNELRKSVIKPVGNPAVYPLSEEQTTVITAHIRNAPPIFSYFDGSGSQIMSDPSIIRDTKMMKLFMVINIDPRRAPADYDLEQYVQLRNLKE